jgi:hypothetical protein
MPISTSFKPLIFNRDNAEFRLSKTQLEVFDCWRRPGEFLEAPDTGQNLNPTMLADEKTDLVQDITSDCSVVASLCAVTARNERGHSNVMLSCLARRNLLV